MAGFVGTFLINSALATLVLYSCYLVAASAMLNLGHGNIAEWRTRLAKLALQLPPDRVELLDNKAIVKAPLSEQTLKDVHSFVGNHRLVSRAEQRLNLVRCWGRIFFLDLIIGFAVGAWMSSPALFGSPNPTVTFPTLVASVGAAGTAGVIFLFNFPHGLDWGRLKDATESLGAG
jgi:hypothetical protein